MCMCLSVAIPELFIVYSAETPCGHQKPICDDFETTQPRQFQAASLSGRRLGVAADIPWSFRRETWSIDSTIRCAYSSDVLM